MLLRQSVSLQLEQTFKLDIALGAGVFALSQVDISVVAIDLAASWERLVTGWTVKLYARVGADPMDSCHVVE